VLSATGRDIAYQELTLRFENCVWQLLEHRTAEQLWHEEIPSFLPELVMFIQERDHWQGTATELLAVLGETETPPNRLTRILARYSAEVLEPAHIRFRTKRTANERMIYLENHDGFGGHDD